MEPLIYLALFLLLALASLLFRWLKAQIEEAPTDHLEAGPWTPPPHRPAKVISARSPTGGEGPSRAGAPRPALSVGSPPLPRRHPARLAARGSRRDLRRGILWMTILGRCRGLEPPGRIVGAGSDMEPPTRP